jgi:hypothetical protein
MTKSVTAMMLGALLATAAIPALADTRADELLANIVETARANTERIDNFAAVRAEIGPMLEELKTVVPQRPLPEDLQLKKGAWKQIWTDDADDLRANNAFQTTDRNRTFQMVLDNGIFYNISEIRTLLGRFTGFLRGTYTPATDGTSIDIAFTRVGLARGDVGPFGSILTRTLGVESGRETLFSIPGERPYPNGPVGAQGNIRTVYIDGSYRIDEGFNKADNVVDLFVLERLGE